jgi:hypothetical protein
MKANLPTLMIAAACLLALGLAASSCADPLSGTRLPRLEKFPVCSGRGSSSISRLNNRSFTRTDPKSCVKSLDPFDLSAWVEAPMNPYTQRGLQKVVLGCANLVPESAGCQYSGLQGHAATMHASFNFARYPVLARVQKAVFAFYAEDNAAFLTQSAQIRGKLNDGDAYQSLGLSRVAPAHTRSPHSGWVVVDVTDFAARAINEQRSDASIDVSLPCGRSEADLATVSLLGRQPVLVAEYK